MKRAPHTAAGPSSRQRKDSECLERKFERIAHPHPVQVTDLQEWANRERGLS